MEIIQILANFLFYLKLISFCCRNQQYDFCAEKNPMTISVEYLWNYKKSNYCHVSIFLLDMTKQRECVTRKQSVCEVKINANWFSSIF